MKENLNESQPKKNNYKKIQKTQPKVNLNPKPSPYKTSSALKASKTLKSNLNQKNKTKIIISKKEKINRKTNSAKILGLPKISSNKFKSKFIGTTTCINVSNIKLTNPIKVYSINKPKKKTLKVQIKPKISIEKANRYKKNVIYISNFKTSYTKRQSTKGKQSSYANNNSKLFNSSLTTSAEVSCSGNNKNRTCKQFYEYEEISHFKSSPEDNIDFSYEFENIMNSKEIKKCNLDQGINDIKLLSNLNSKNSINESVSEEGNTNKKIHLKYDNNCMLTFGNSFSTNSQKSKSEIFSNEKPEQTSGFIKYNNYLNNGNTNNSNSSYFLKLKEENEVLKKELQKSNDQILALKFKIEELKEVKFPQSLKKRVVSQPIIYTNKKVRPSSSCSEYFINLYKKISKPQTKKGLKSKQNTYKIKIKRTNEDLAKNTNKNTELDIGCRIAQTKRIVIQKKNNKNKMRNRKIMNDFECETKNEFFATSKLNDCISRLLI